MDYKKHYDSLIHKGKNRDWKTLPYFEKHHIKPKSENGLDIEENVVRLTAREHFIAHWLLYRLDESIQSRAFSFWRMCNGRGSTPKEHWIIISSRCYQKARLAHSKAISKALKGRKKSKEHAAKVGLAVKGQKRTEEQKMKLRKPHKMTEDGLRRLRESKAGKLAHNIKSVNMLNKDTMDILEVFDSLKKAADFVGVNNSNIHAAIKKNRMSGGYKWNYA
ncbi:MAG: HNH endonuclease signature motif containing protein [Planctomycetota bacterium]|nr:HNH endonuclease signature motif containing protein [Planctomycetota bacterium]